MIAFFAVFVGHVPQYDGCDHNCCHPPHAPTTSQVAYLKGSGGVEFDEHSLKEDSLDFNFVFKKAYDVSTFSMYAGCGGCASEMPFYFDEPLSLPLAQPEAYHSPRFEPFTQVNPYSKDTNPNPNPNPNPHRSTRTTSFCPRERTRGSSTLPRCSATARATT